MMKKLTLSLANEAIEQILELSADTQITRRLLVQDDTKKGFIDLDFAFVFDET
jgi:hypothetical protein